MGIPLAGVLLVLFFIYRGFPYAQLASTLETALGRRLAAQVVIRDLGPRLQWLGPGIEASGVRVAWNDGTALELDTAIIRPAWSLSWLRGAPAIHADLTGPFGNVSGTFVDGGASGAAWTGQVTELDLAQLPFEPWPGIQTRGWIDADIDVRLGEAGPEGSVHFLAKEGSVKLPDIPMPVPYDTCKGDLRLGDGAFVQIDALELVGPLLSADVTGQVGAAPRLDMAPLQLEVRLTAEPAIRAVLQAAGLRVDRDGSAQLRVTGTPATPILR